MSCAHRASTDWVGETLKSPTLIVQTCRDSPQTLATSSDPAVIAASSGAFSATKQNPFGQFFCNVHIACVRVLGGGGGGGVTTKLTHPNDKRQPVGCNVRNTCQHGITVPKDANLRCWHEVHTDRAARGAECAALASTYYLPAEHSIGWGGLYQRYCKGLRARA